MYKGSLQFGDRIRVAYIEGHDVFQVLQSMVMRAFSYPLPIMTISEDECTKTIAPILINVFAKLQVMRHIKTDVIYGTIHL